MNQNEEKTLALEPRDIERLKKNMAETFLMRFYRQFGM